MKIHLVRHGEAAANWQESDDPELSELGHRQAGDTAAQLLELVEPDVQLISSPLIRAQQTAMPLSERLAKDITVLEPFREIPTPVAREERQAWLNSIARKSWGAQHDMVITWRTAMLNQLRQIDQSTVVFTHFMVLNAIVSELTAEDKVVCFLPDNASVTTIQLKNDKLELVELGRQLRTIVQ